MISKPKPPSPTTTTPKLTYKLPVVTTPKLIYKLPIVSNKYKMFGK